MEKLKVKKYNQNKGTQNSKILNVILFILIFIFSISTIITIQIKSYNADITKDTIKESDVVSTQSIKDITDIENHDDSEQENIYINKDIQIEKDNGYILPVDEEILLGYSENSLIYNETLDDWRLHVGTDFHAEKGSIVKSIADGVIKDIYYDSIKGNVIIISHNNGYESRYSNIDISANLFVGDELKKGMLIGYINENPPFEANSKLHIHFELYKDGLQIDPMSIKYE